MLGQYVQNTMGDPFEWGRNDCALWCAGAVQFVTGQDPAADLRGTYDRAFGARQMIQRAGGMLALIAPRMDALRLPDLDGDGVAVARIGALTVCAVVIAERAITKTETGLGFCDDFEIVRGWSCHRH